SSVFILLVIECFIFVCWLFFFFFFFFFQAEDGIRDLIVTGVQTCALPICLPATPQVMKDTVLDLRSRGKTILFSTHIMEQAEKLCEQLCIIARGRKLVDGALSDIKRTRSGHHLVIGFDGSLGGAPQVFADKALVSKVDNYGQYAELEL